MVLPNVQINIWHSQKCHFGYQYLWLLTIKCQSNNMSITIYGVNVQRMSLQINLQEIWSRMSMMRYTIYASSIKRDKSQVLNLVVWNNRVIPHISPYLYDSLEFSNNGLVFQYFESFLRKIQWTALLVNCYFQNLPPQEICLSASYVWA